MHIFGIVMAKKGLHEKIKVSDDAIGVVSYRKGGKINEGSLYFDIPCSNEIDGRELQFDKRNMTLKVTELDGGGRKPTKQGNNYLLHVSSIPVTFDGYGYYEMVLEGNKYKLYPIEE